MTDPAVSKRVTRDWLTDLFADASERIDAAIAFDALPADPPASVRMGKVERRPGLDLTGYAEPASGDVEAARVLHEGPTLHRVGEPCGICEREAAIRAEAGTLDVELLDDLAAFGHGQAFPGLGHTQSDWRACPQRLCQRAQAEFARPAGADRG